ncbi:MAG TPA: four helix bundle protein, partial [Bdellovibrionales bacterium]|nr:four helix bundle protein [Bdellovibrionales bacterium]
MSSNLTPSANFAVSKIPLISKIQFPATPPGEPDIQSAKPARNWTLEIRDWMEFGRLKVETEYLRTEIGFLIASRWFMQFTFEKLEVYKHAIDWVKESENIIERSRHGMSRTLADQLSRASLSIPLNIAEGNGRWHAGDKRQFFWIARGSVFECVPIIDVLRIKNL